MVEGITPDIRGEVIDVYIVSPANRWPDGKSKSERWADGQNHGIARPEELGVEASPGRVRYKCQYMRVDRICTI